MRRITVLGTIASLIVFGASLIVAEDKPADAAAPAAPAAAAAAPAAAPAMTTAMGPAVKEVKILVDKKAKSNGEIRFDFIPEGGTAKQTRVTVMKGMDKKDICRDIAKELAVLTGSEYDVDQYDPDKVKVEGKTKFNLTISGQTVSGLSVTLK